MDPNAQLKYCKACSVSYSMKVLVEEELDRLAKEGAIEPITFSECVAPTVPVLKSDKKSVRICGDFKLTVNQAAVRPVSYSQGRGPVFRAGRWPGIYKAGPLSNLPANLFQ